MITKKYVLLEMQKALPEYKIDPEWLADGSTYPAFNDFARFICADAEVLKTCSEAEVSELTTIKASMKFMEQALLEGDNGVRDLVLECMETLWSCEWIKDIEKYFGPEVNKLWLLHFSGRAR